jgi:Secretion system C-terminal sorting domain
MMIDNDGDGDYTTGTQNFITPTSITGNILSFTGVTFPTSAVFTIITQATGSPLPAIWKDFSVQLKNNSALLSWKTTNEYNVARYEVEHSLDGSNYQSIGNTVAINAAGVNVYSFTHENLVNGKHYYRVKLVDTDGKYQYSITKNISAGGKPLTKVFIKSNPAQSNRLDIVADVLKNTKASLSIVSLDGRTIQKLDRNVSEGRNNISVDISGLAIGTYVLRTLIDKEVYTTKFIKQ